MLSSKFGRWGLALAFDVRDLAADHAIHGAAAEGKFFDERDFAAGAETFDADQRLHGKSEQRVAGEDRHGFAEDFVAGRFAAAEIVVIERRQIVVDQRIGVDHLERASGFQCGIT